MSFERHRTSQPKAMSLIGPEPPFCEVGSLLALQFLRASHAAVESAYQSDPSTLQAEVSAALAELLEHVRGNGVTERCPNCWED